MNSIAKAYVQIIPSAEGIKGKITSALGGEAKSAGESAGKSVGSSMIGSIKNMILAAGIGTAITKGISSSIRAGADLEQSLGGVETLFKEHADRVIKDADHAWKTAGLSSNDYMQTVTSFSASLLQSLGGDTEKAAEYSNRAIVDMSDNANKMGTSMEAIQNAYNGFAKQNYTMLDNLKLGYGGTQKEMQRLIKDASQMTTEMENLGVSVDSSDMSFGNIVNAISVMQEHLGIAGTTALEASTTISGSVGAMKSAFQNVLADLALGRETLGQSILSVWETVVTLGTNLIPVFQNIATGIKDTVVPGIISAAQDIIPGFVNTISSSIPVLINSGVSMMQNIGSGLQQAIPEFLAMALPLLLQFSENVLSNVGTLVDAGIEMIGNIVDGLVASIPSLIKYAPTIITNFANVINQNLPKILLAGAQMILKLVNGIIQNIPLIKENIRNIIQMIISVWGAINWMSLGSTLVTKIGSGIRSLISHIPDVLKTIGQTACNVFKSINWASVGSAVINLIVSGIKAVLSAIPNALKGIGTSAMSAFKGLSWNSIGSSIVSGIATGISGAVGAVVEAAKGVASSAIQAAKNLLGIHSPSRVFRDQVGKQISEGMAVGILGSADSAVKAIHSVTDDLIGNADLTGAITGTVNVSPGYNVNSVERIANILMNMETATYAAVARALSEYAIKWDDRELGRMVRYYAG